MAQAVGFEKLLVELISRQVEFHFIVVLSRN